MQSQLQMTSLELGVSTPWIGVAAAPAAAAAVLLALLAMRRRRALLSSLGMASAPRGRGPAGASTWFRVAALALVVLMSFSPTVTVYRFEELSADNAMLYRGSVTHLLLLDVSKSMAPWFSAAREFVERYLEGLPKSDRVTLVLFYREVEELCSSRTQCLELLRGVEPGKRFSAVGTALGYAYSLASLTPGPRVVVLVSDCANNYGPNPLEVLEGFSRAGIPVVIARVGSDPRGSWAVEAARRGLAKLVSLSVDPGVVRDAALDAVEEARFSALRASEVIRVPVAEAREVLSPYLAVAAVVLMALGGAGWRPRRA